MAVPPAFATDADFVQETLLGEALEHAPVGALVFDDAGRKLAANRMACALTGYERDELLVTPPSELAAEPERVPEWLQELASGELEHGEGRMRRKDGSLMEIEFRTGATRSGGLPFFVFVFWEAAGDDD